MTAKEAFSVLSDRYTDNFNWIMLTLSSENDYFVNELKKETGLRRFLYEKSVIAIAKCESNDNVLYMVEDESEKFPRYREFADSGSAMSFIEQDLLENYI